MRLPKRLSDAVMFANWCSREGIDPAPAARLIVLAHRAHRAGEISCNTGERARYERAMQEFDTVAASMGFVADWPGLWPTLSRNGQDVYLPSL